MKLVAGNDSAATPGYFLADVRRGERQQLFRSDVKPFCWSLAGLLVTRGIVDLAKSGVHGMVLRNSGYHIPWDGGLYASVERMNCGHGGTVAAERWVHKPGNRTLAQQIEMYRQLPGRNEWVRTGRILPSTRGENVVWYPNNPNWLRDGRLMYLRLYPAQWTPPSTPDARPIPQAKTAKNRVEVWLCSSDGRHQSKVLTLSDLRVYVQDSKADWFTVDGSGKTICYLSYDRVRILHLARPLVRRSPL